MEEDPEVDEPGVLITLRCFAGGASAAATALEKLNRIMLGLTLEGMEVVVTTDLIEVFECDHDHSEPDVE